MPPKKKHLDQGKSPAHLFGDELPDSGCTTVFVLGWGVCGRQIRDTRGDRICVRLDDEDEWVNGEECASALERECMPRRVRKVELGVGR
jgi:hypothetical protein